MTEERRSPEERAAELERLKKLYAELEKLNIDARARVIAISAELEKSTKEKSQIEKKLRDLYQDPDAS